MTTQALQKTVQTEIAERGIPAPTWATMLNTLYPGAAPASVLLVWDYCQARKLDPLKKPVHIVPMRVKQGDDYVWRDVVLPGIYEYRITAHRTGEYLGHDKVEYGPTIEAFGVKAPEWAEMTVYRWNEKAQTKVPYSVRILFVEACGTKKKDKTDATLVANGRWERAPVQMLTKCVEAAALREAFPEAIGGEPTVDEIQDHMPEVIDVTPAAPIPTSWARLSEPLQEQLEKAFAALKWTAAQRLAKVNQFIPNDATAEEGGLKLLDVCKDEYAAAQGRSRTKTVDNAKKPTESAQSPTPDAAKPSADGPGASRVDPNGGASDVRPARAEAVAGVEPTPSPSADLGVLF